VIGGKGKGGVGHQVPIYISQLVLAVKPLSNK
jgi:hypothetical protein